MHIYTVRCPRRDDLQKFLTAEGVQTMIHYPIPPHHQPAYAAWSGLARPVTEKIHREVMSLPMGPHLSLEQAGTVAEVINRWRG